MNLRAKFVFSIGFLGLLCIVLPGSARADLVGTTVTGSLDFDADGLNFYNPAMGFVPAGFQNSAGAQDSNTVVIVGGNEFGFTDGINTDVTSFSSTGFTFTQTSIIPGKNINIILTMTDPAFTGVSLISSTFPGLTFAISGDQITVDIPGITVSAGEVLTASFNVYIDVGSSRAFHLWPHADRVWVFGIGDGNAEASRSEYPASQLNA